MQRRRFLAAGALAAVAPALCFGVQQPFYAEVEYAHPGGEDEFRQGLALLEPAFGERFTQVTAFRWGWASQAFVRTASGRAARVTVWRQAPAGVRIVYYA